MKKTISVIFLCIAFSLGAVAQEFALGAKAGIAASWLSGYPMLETTRPLPHNGFCGGISAEYTFANEMLVQGEVLYCSKGHSANVVGLDEYHFSHNMNYIQVPVYVGMKLADDALSVMIGPELGVVLSDNVKPGDALMGLKYNINPVQLFIAMQMTYMVGDNFGFDLKFDFGASYMFRSGARPISAQIGVCYKFDI